MMDKKTNNLLQLPCQLKDFVGLNTNPTGSHNPATLGNIRTQGLLERSPTAIAL